jgi:tetratricopeptide (TPR) repeat protein
MTRLQGEAAALSFDAALQRSQHDRVLTDEALTGLLGSISILGHKDAVVAISQVLAANESGQLHSNLPDSHGVNWAAGFNPILEEIRSRYPDFERSFQEGRIRLNENMRMYSGLTRPARHYGKTKYLRSLRARFAQQKQALLLIFLLLAIPVIVAILTLQYFEYRPGLWLISLAVLIVGVYLYVMLRSTRGVFRDLYDTWYQVRFSNVLNRKNESDVTHEEALGVLSRFAQSREPFALYLRSFEAEAREFESRLGFTLEPDRIDDQDDAASRRFVVNYGAGSTDLDRYLYRELFVHLPVITLANPAAGSPTFGGRERATPRLEVENNLWEPMVRHLVSAAYMIIVEATVDGPGLRRELDLIVENQRAPDTIIVLPSREEREEVLRRRALSGVALDDGPPFVSAASSSLKAFGRIVDLPQVSSGKPEDLAVFQGLLPDPVRQDIDARVTQRSRRRDVREQATDALLEGEALLSEGQAEEAREKFSASRMLSAHIGNAPKEAMALIWMSEACFRVGDFDAAERNLRAALELQSNVGPPAEYVRSLFAFERFLRERGRTREAGDVAQSLREAKERWELDFASHD